MYRFVGLTLFYTAVTCLLSWPLPGRLSSEICGNGGDNYQNMWNLWWFKKALLELHVWPFHTPYLWHPTGHTLLFHTLSPFNCLLSIPLQFFLGLGTVYNILIEFSFVSTALATYYLARHLVGSGRAALVAGLVFAFCPYHFAHSLGHLSMVSTEGLPLFALFYLQTLDRGGWRNIGLATLALVMLAWCDWLYLYYAGFLGSLLWLRRPKVAGVLPFVFCVLLLSPQIVAMQTVLRQQQLSGAHSPDEFCADLASFFVPSEILSWGEVAHPVWSRFSGNESENANYLGAIAAALALYAIIRVPRCRFWAAALLLFAVLSLGPHLHFLGQHYAVPLPYLALHRYLPYFAMSGMPVRFLVLVYLCLAILVGYAMSDMRRRGTGSIRLALLGVFLCLDYLCIPLQTVRPEVPGFYHQLARDREQYAVFDFPAPALGVDLYLATIHGKPILGGYVSRRSQQAQKFFTQDEPLLGALVGGPVAVNLPTRAELPSYAQRLFARHNIRYLITRSPQLSLFYDQYLGLRRVYESDGIHAYDCRAPFKPAAAVPALAPGSLRPGAGRNGI